MASRDIIINIEHTKGTSVSFDIDNNPTWDEYPLRGVTYPVDYGHISGHVSEDGYKLDVFVGTGELFGYIRIWRCDIPEETKFVVEVTKQEWESILETFRPVLTKATLFFMKENCVSELQKFRGQRG